MNSHTGSNIARAKKVRAGPLSLRRPGKSKLGRHNNNKMRLTEWNVGTLLDNDRSKRPQWQTALVAKELDRYKIDIAALSETRLPLYDSLIDHGYTFFWSGRDISERREAGVGSAINNSIAQNLEQDPMPINDRIMKLRLPLQRDVYATIISTYAPTMTNPDEVKENSYASLRDVVKQIPSKDKLIISGNAMPSHSQYHSLCQAKLNQLS